MAKRLKDKTNEPVYFDFGGGRSLGQIMVKDKPYISKKGEELVKRTYILVPLSRKLTPIPNGDPIETFVPILDEKIEIFSKGKKRVYFKDGVLRQRDRKYAKV